MKIDDLDSLRDTISEIGRLGDAAEDMTQELRVELRALKDLLASLEEE